MMPEWLDFSHVTGQLAAATNELNPLLNQLK